MGDYANVALYLTRTGAAKLATAIEADVNNTTEDFASSAIEELVGGGLPTRTWIPAQWPFAGAG